MIIYNLTNISELQGGKKPSQKGISGKHVRWETNGPINVVTIKAQLPLVLVASVIQLHSKLKGSSTEIFINVF